MRSLIVAALVVLSSWAGVAQDPPLPNGPGKDVFESVCSLCHSTSAVVGKQWTRNQWDSKIIEMLQEEPDVTAKERAAILEYLSASFKPPEKINVNKASVKDLAAVLEISASDAEAIVRYRDANGSFKGLDDRKKVPGLNAARVDAKKDRLEF